MPGTLFASAPIVRPPARVWTLACAHSRALTRVRSRGRGNEKYPRALDRWSRLNHAPHARVMPALPPSPRAGYAPRPAPIEHGQPGGAWPTWPAPVAGKRVRRTSIRVCGFMRRGRSAPIRIWPAADLIPIPGRPRRWTWWPRALRCGLWNFGNWWGHRAATSPRRRTSRRHATQVRFQSPTPRHAALFPLNGETPSTASNLPGAVLHYQACRAPARPAKRRGIVT